MTLRETMQVLTVLGVLTGNALVGSISIAQAPQASKQDNADSNDHLGLADLPAYRAALSGRPTRDEANPSEAARDVGFRELWDHSETFRGHRVRIQGRVERIFRQPAVGSFPPLAEAWVTTPAGEPYCVIFPLESGELPQPGVVANQALSTVPEKGKTVEFVGTYLKRIRYAAVDGERLAPLIVGDKSPVVSIGKANATKARSSVAGRRPQSPSADPSGLRSESIGWLAGPGAKWLIAGIVAILAGGLLARQHFRRPITPVRPRIFDEPAMAELPLEFLDRGSQLPGHNQGRNGDSHH